MIRPNPDEIFSESDFSRALRFNAFDNVSAYAFAGGIDPFLGRHMDHISQDPLTDGSAEDTAAQRNDARDSLLLAARFRIEGSAEITQVRVRNLSSGGLMADVPKPIDIGTMVEVEVRGVGWVNGRIAWIAAGRAGVAFDHPIDPQAARKPVVASSGPVKDKPIKPLF